MAATPSTPPHRPHGATTLRCPVTDQTQLHGVLAALRDIGADLVDVRRDPAARPAARTPALDP